VVAVFAVLMVGAFAGSVEGDRGDGCHRTSCYQRYDRDYQMAATPTAGAMLIAATPAAAVTARVAMVGAAIMMAMAATARPTGDGPANC
jgi:hypothetical protein